MRITFNQYKLKKLIEWEGVEYTFLRDQVNQHGEPIDELIDVSTVVKGVFHQGSLAYISLKTSDSATVQTKNQTYIVAQWEQAESLKINDYLFLNGRRYKVTGVNNIGELNTFADICIEVVL